MLYNLKFTVKFFLCLYIILTNICFPNEIVQPIHWSAFLTFPEVLKIKYFLHPIHICMAVVVIFVVFSKTIPPMLFICFLRHSVVRSLELVSYLFLKIFLLFQLQEVSPAESHDWMLWSQC